MASEFSPRRHCWPSAGREQLGAAWPFHATAVRVQHSSSRHGVTVCPRNARYVHTIINCSLSTQAPAPSRASALGCPGGNSRARACKGNRGKGDPGKQLGSITTPQKVGRLPGTSYWWSCASGPAHSPGVSGGHAMRAAYSLETQGLHVQCVWCQKWA